MLAKIKQMLNTPFGSFFKISLGILLAALLDYANTEGDFGVGEPWDKLIGLLVIAGVPIVINYLNTSDARYGRVEGGEEPPGEG